MLRFEPIVFDLDGTLVDSGADIAAAVNRTLASLGLAALAPTEIIGFVGDGVRKLMERTLARFGRDDLDAALARFMTDYRQNCLVATRPYPGIERLLARLAGARLGVVTNKPADFARKVLAGLGLEPAIAALVGGDEGPRKPRPDPIRLVLDRLGASAEGGLMIGDHENDVLAGRAAGLATCGVTWGFDGGHSLLTRRPDHLCHEVRELEALLIA